MLIVIGMSEMFQQCLQERKRVLYENLWCNCEQVPVVIGKAHNIVFCNWLVMSSKEKMIMRIFMEVGLSNVQRKSVF